MVSKRKFYFKPHPSVYCPSYSYFMYLTINGDGWASMRDKNSKNSLATEL